MKWMANRKAIIAPIVRHPQPANVLIATLFRLTSLVRNLRNLRFHMVGLSRAHLNRMRKREKPSRKTWIGPTKQTEADFLEVT